LEVSDVPRDSYRHQAVGYAPATKLMG